MTLLKKQTIHPKRRQTLAPPRISDILLTAYDSHVSPDPRIGWRRSQYYREENFILVAAEGRQRGAHELFFHTQEDYIKFHFRLTGNKTSIICNGYGEYEFNRPQLFILTAPSEMLKIDRFHYGAYSASVSLLLRREFFTCWMGLEPEALPAVLRAMIYSRSPAFAMHAESLGQNLGVAARTVLTAMCGTRLDQLYHRAKAIELVCLVIDQLWRTERQGRSEKTLTPRKIHHLHQVRALIDERFTDAMTLDGIALKTGLGRTALTSGFLRLFGMSVFDYIQYKRMLLAQELLRDTGRPITDIAEAVGYTQLSNFSSAFRQYFGCSPRDIRGRP